MQTVHTLFHKFKLLLAGTVACLVFGGESIPILCKNFLGIVERQFGKGQSPYEKIWSGLIGDI